MTQKLKKHSIEDLEKLQHVLEESLFDTPGVRGIGIGLNSDRTDYAFKVMIEKENVAEDLPSKIEDVEVIHEVAGPAKAY